MISDIVERLKSAPTYYGEETALLDDAIAEIEKLRAALDSVIDVADYYPLTQPEKNILRAAAAALKETGDE